MVKRGRPRLMKCRGALQEILDAQIAFKVANQQEFAELQEDFADIEEIKDSKASDSAEEEDMCRGRLQCCHHCVPAQPGAIPAYPLHAFHLCTNQFAEEANHNSSLWLRSQCPCLSQQQ